MDLAPGEEALEEPCVCSRCTSTAHSNPSYKARKLCRVSKEVLSTGACKEQLEQLWLVRMRSLQGSRHWDLLLSLLKSHHLQMS